MTGEVRDRRSYRSRSVSSGASANADDRRFHHRRQHDRYRKLDENGRSRSRERSHSREQSRKRRATSRDDEATDDVAARRRERQDPSARDRQARRRDDRDLDDRRQRRRRSNSDERRRPGALTRRSRSPEPLKRSKGPLPSQKDAFQGTDVAVTPSDVKKERPNYNTTGRLAAASNTVQKGGQSIVLKYHEPAEARKPSRAAQWRVYVFKDDKIIDTVELAEQSCWLFGREAAVVDVLLEHPSTSKQHAVIQFRYVEKQNEFGDRKGRVRPYILDLESANGTTVNEEMIPEAQYVELRDKDVVKFGRSSREYIIQLPPAESRGEKP